MSHQISQAREMLLQASRKSLSNAQRIEKAIELAALMLEAANLNQSTAEYQRQAELSRMMHDPVGKTFTTALIDQCFRTQDPKRVASQIIYLIESYGVPSYLSLIKRIGLTLFPYLGKIFPHLLVLILKEQIRKETKAVILPGEVKAIKQHLILRQQKMGAQLNLNHLGEAILGEEEALHRLRVYLDDLGKPEIQCVSVKVSTICSQLNLLAWEETLATLTDRLKQLYRAAQGLSKLVNLDMEEYRDLHITVETFQRTLDEPEFFNYSAGIVLQSYLPDSFAIQQKLTEWAKKRVASGGAPIWLRVVKGANLAMEQVDASLHGWPQAPYQTKLEVDANYLRMLHYGCELENGRAVHIGVGSHNLFDIAYLLLLRAEEKIEKLVRFEMLEGMANAMSRVVHELSGDLLLYCPVARKEEFHTAIAYLIRRLDENTAPENFLRSFFGLHPDTLPWKGQAELFKRSFSEITALSSTPRRLQNRFHTTNAPSEDQSFQNEPDTDWTLPHHRSWAEKIIHCWEKKTDEEIPVVINGEKIFTMLHSQSGKNIYRYSQATPELVEKAIAIAMQAQSEWSKKTVAQRSKLLARVAEQLRRRRVDLIGAMVADTGKTILEADAEVSEAVDFAEYYRRSAKKAFELSDIDWKPKGPILVASPWNFPCSIPAGGILAALAAGNCVIFKPAPEAVLVGWLLAQIFWEAGIGWDVLQFLPCTDEPVGTQLVRDQRIAAVILTGGTTTARLMMQLRPGIDLMAETGGKNAIIVSNMADRDLAVRDIVQSAFGYSGQKCSACSLVVCLSEVYEDPLFRKQLRDAAVSLPVGSPWNLATKINPLIRAPAQHLLRALTTLEEGEEWLLKPRQDAKNPLLWSPGIKLGVQPGSFTHQTELFGPVLGVMCAKDLPHAIQLVNATPYGLTSGLHSLDEREQCYWQQGIVAGNCYINRGITGAIVRRQPFGGCKNSGFGPGAKAGGPNYVMQLMHPTQKKLESTYIRELPSKYQTFVRHLPLNDIKLFEQSLASYLFYWENYFSHQHDPSQVLGEDNLFFYRPQETMFFRIQEKNLLADVFRVIAAADICGTSLEISCDPNCQLPIMDAAFEKVKFETEDTLIARLQEAEVKRIRVVTALSRKLLEILAVKGATVHGAPVLVNGRVELLNYLREVSVSNAYHRYGNLLRRDHTLA